MKYISHLDLNRCMARALRRSGVPVWYTQGFTPHPYVTFALPLSLGHESVCEVMDFRLLDGTEQDGAANGPKSAEAPVTPVTPQKDVSADTWTFARVKEQLARQMPPGLAIREVYAPGMKYGDITYARYRVTLCVSLPDGTEIGSALDAFFAEPVWIEKKTKHGIKQIDVSPLYRAADKSFDGGTAVLEALLPAGSTENINPGCFAQAVGRMPGAAVISEAVMRLGLFTGAGEPFR